MNSVYSSLQLSSTHLISSYTNANLLGSTLLLHVNYTYYTSGPSIRQPDSQLLLYLCFGKVWPQRLCAAQINMLDLILGLVRINENHQADTFLQAALNRHFKRAHERD